MRVKGLWKWSIISCIFYGGKVLDVMRSQYLIVRGWPVVISTCQGLIGMTAVEWWPLCWCSSQWHPYSGPACHPEGAHPLQKPAGPAVEAASCPAVPGDPLILPWGQVSGSTYFTRHTCSLPLYRLNLQNCYSGPTSVQPFIKLPDLCRVWPKNLFNLGCVNDSPDVYNSWWCWFTASVVTS